MWDAEKLAKLRYSGLLRDLEGAAHWCATADNDGHMNAALARLSIVVDAISDLLLGLDET